MDLQKIVKALYIYGTAFFKILILPNSKYFLFSADPLGGVSLEERKVGVAAPKMFAFDSVFTDQDLQEDVANSALSGKLMHSVKITQIYSHTFLTKISWKQLVLWRSYFWVDFTKYFFCESEFLVFPHCFRFSRENFIFSVKSKY